MKTYTLKAESYGYNFHVEVSADELRRVLIQEGAGLSAGLIRSLFDMSFESIFALRREYDLRGGPAAITPEAVARTFGPRPWSTFGSGGVEHVAAHVLRPPQRAAIATVHGGQPGTTYEVDLDRLTVTVVGMTVSADELRVHIGAADIKPSVGAKLERRCAAAPRRRPWDGVSVYPWRRDKKGGRPGDHLQRRQPGAAPRRQRGEDRRISRRVGMTTWAHWCVADFKRLTVLISPHCAQCGQGRFQVVERRRLAHRRSYFINGRRGEDA